MKALSPLEEESTEDTILARIRIEGAPPSFSDERRGQGDKVKSVQNSLPGLRNADEDQHGCSTKEDGTKGGAAMMMCSERLVVSFSTGDVVSFGAFLL